MYTTLSPCDMCTGACVLYKVGRVVVGENKSFVGGEAYLKERGIEVVVMESAECMDLMQRFMKDKPEVWWVSSLILIFVFSWCEKSCLTENMVVGTRILESELNVSCGV